MSKVYARGLASSKKRCGIMRGMIATLSGNLSEKILDQVVMDVGGVGYGLQVSAEDYGRLQVGEKAKLYVYEHVREQSYDLFGFTSLANKGLFELLLGVKNVGPKVAMGVLDAGSAGMVRTAIANGDVRFLQGAKGVGKRAAEQIVVELRDRVGIEASEAAEGIVTRPGVGMQDEAAEALVSLGYTPQDAAMALKNVDKDLPAEERIKQALKGGA